MPVYYFHSSFLYSLVSSSILFLNIFYEFLKLDAKENFLDVDMWEIYVTERGIMIYTHPLVLLG